MLGAFQSLYQHSTIGIKVEGRTAIRVPSVSGVKQGCPLSPILFGLFVDGLFRYLKAHCPEDGVLLPDGQRLRQLGYADDFVLLSPTAAGLQRLLDAAFAWCGMTGMLISAEKSKVMIFGGGGLAPPQYTCGGQVLERVSSFVYLGVEFDSEQGVRGTFPRLHTNMWGAFSLIQRQYGKLSCPPAVGLLLDLYNACVPPTASCGCEVWAFLPASGEAARMRSRLPTSHLHMLKLIAGVPTSVCTDLLFRELGVRSLEQLWWKRTVCFWNNIASLPPTSVHYQVAVQNCTFAVAQGSRNWAFGVMSSLRRIGYPFTIRCDHLHLIDWSAVRTCLKRREDEAWTGLHISPRFCPSSRAQRCTYFRWFAKPSHYPRQLSAVRLPLGARLVRSYLRFRLGCHYLPIVVGRRTGVPRSERLCPHCSLGDLGDERHLVFICPAVQHVRDKYAHLFTRRGLTMRQFLWQDDMISVVRFVAECLDILQSTVAASHQP